MASHTRIFNQTRGYSLKHKQAVRAVENCACAWVEFGVSVRDLTLKESIEARNQQAKTREPLPFAELPNCIFRHPGHENALFAERMRAIEAKQFAQLAEV